MRTGSGRDEAEVFARYLVGHSPPAEMRERYERAVQLRLGAAPEPSDGNLLAFALRFPWALPSLDAAAGLLRPAGGLRTRLLLMAAVLEASPTFADEFLPRPAGRLALWFRVAALALRATGKAVIGLLLYPLAFRFRA